jgi:hypothetical protein
VLWLRQEPSGGEGRRQQEVRGLQAEDAKLRDAGREKAAVVLRLRA